MQYTHTQYSMTWNLFQAYDVVLDNIFKREVYLFEGLEIMYLLKLMKWVKSKYNKLIAQDGQWQVPNEKAEKIIVLEAQTKQLKTQKNEPASWEGQGESHQASK